MPVQERRELGHYLADRCVMPLNVVEQELTRLTVVDLTIIELDRRRRDRVRHTYDYDPFART